MPLDMFDPDGPSASMGAARHLIFSTPLGLENFRAMHELGSADRFCAEISLCQVERVSLQIAVLQRYLLFFEFTICSYSNNSTYLDPLDLPCV